jgi:medium-chain acyl-[acyl-carrier-protein] hydrolase
LERRQGIPAEVLAETELLNLLLPMVRADFKLHETAEYHDEPPLACSITTFGGSQDPIVSPEALSAWSVQTAGSFKQLAFPGNHFFLRTTEKQLLHAIKEAGVL